MIDNRKNELKSIQLDDADMANMLSKPLTVADMLSQQTEVQAAIVKAGEKAGIPKKHQGPIFVKGEEIEIKGVKFAIHGIGKRELVLRTINSPSEA